MIKDNPDLNEKDAEEPTSPLWSIRTANSANKERPLHSSREEQLAQAKASRQEALRGANRQSVITVVWGPVKYP